MAPLWGVAKVDASKSLLDSFSLTFCILAGEEDLDLLDLPSSSLLSSRGKKSWELGTSSMPFIIAFGIILLGCTILFGGPSIVVGGSR